MHANEYDISAGLVQRLIDSQFPEYADLALTKVDSAGTDNAIFRLGDTMCVRLPRIEEATAKIQKEYRWLPQLKPLPLETPKPLHLGSPSREYPWPWSIYAWIDADGTNSTALQSLSEDARHLAAFIKALQSRDTKNAPLYGDHNNLRGAPLAGLDIFTREAIHSLGDKVDGNGLTEVWQSALEAREWVGAPVWVHGDIHAGNLLTRKGRLHAVIDFGLLGLGDPACDLMVAWTLFSTDSRAVFKNAMNVDNDSWLRGRGWALFFAVLALEYYFETNPFLTNLARYTINEVLLGG